MKFRSGDLLFRVKGSKVEFRGSWRPNMSSGSMLLAVWAPFWEAFFDQKPIKNRCKFWYDFWYGFWLIFDHLLEAFWINIWAFLNNFSKTAISWKRAPLQWKINIFKVWSLRKSIKNRCYFRYRFQIDFWSISGASEPWKWCFRIGEVLFVITSLFRKKYPKTINFVSRKPPKIIQNSIKNHITNYIKKYIDV